ncbi:MAG: HAD family hydrolase [Erysipelotrichales bacterium]|nr:HAD family hydrolase [Erysipelotrichales bacterium]
MKYKIVFIDIDNTLYDHTNKEVPASTIETLHKAHKNGMEVVICTGRSLALIKQLEIDKLVPIDGYIACNGAIAYDRHENIYFATPFDTDEIESIINICKKHDVGIQYISDNVSFISIPLNHKIIEACKTFHINNPVYKEYERERVCQGILFADQNDEEILRPYFKDFKLNRFHEFALDIYLEGVNKGEAIKRYLSLKNIDLNEAIAIGDANNDLEMLEVVPNSIAMGNGTELAKAKASFVTTPVYEDGIKNAFDYLKVFE